MVSAGIPEEEPANSGSALGDQLPTGELVPRGNTPTSVASDSCLSRPEHVSEPVPPLVDAPMAYVAKLKRKHEVYSRQSGAKVGQDGPPSSSAKGHLSPTQL